MSPKKISFCPYCAAPFEKKQLYGRERLVCTGCGEIYYRNPLPAATALVLNADNQLLLGRRAVEPARGGWCLPGGFIEIGETMEQAALRELKEETGLEGRVLRFVGCFYHDSAFYGGVIIFGYQVEVLSGVLKAGDDMESLAYRDLNGLPEVAFDTHRRLIDCLKR
ncbi:MAG: NUDIX domain-containing protein [Deltaproteobacteria bacterium]|nr:NUDIX domain-containing protein [Deltaproteobacteria bacterium]